MTLFGYGKTTSAIAKKFGNCKIYDDNFDSVEKFNSNELLPMAEFNPEASTLEIPSPGIVPTHPTIKSAKNLISEYDLFAKDMPYSIWISGTNGKTTTTAMIQHLLEKYQAVSGGNIGTPLADLDPEAKIWILETSSFTLHYTNIAKPNLYILLPISEDHIEWHGSFEAYEAAKLKPLSMLVEGEIALVPSKYINVPTSGSLIAYDDSSTLAKEFSIDMSRVNFIEPFLTDALLALAVSKILFNEVDYDLLNTFIVGSHKLESFKDSEDRTWIDDSKATNIDATIAALKSFKEEKLYLILGGDDKGANMQVLFDTLQEYDVELFLIGKNYQKLSSLAIQHNIVFVECGLLDIAVSKIAQKHTKNSVALLSPAAASLDQFSSYKERGEKFKEYVAKT
jgi:UDP-N-acetylmuramoylalanine--D-glutamate ligase